MVPGLRNRASPGSEAPARHPGFVGRSCRSRPRVARFQATVHRRRPRCELVPGQRGHVFLWTLAARMLDNTAYERLAIGAGWHAGSRRSWPHHASWWTFKAVRAEWTTKWSSERTKYRNFVLLRRNALIFPTHKQKIKYSFIFFMPQSTYK